MRWRFAACGVALAAGFLAACGTPHHKISKPPVTKPAPPKENDSLPWPTYGADNARTRAVTAPGIRPPFRRLWTFHGHTLLEFPPVAGYGMLYEESFDGLLHAIDPKTGKELWRYDSHYCGWSSPALGGGRIFATFIANASCSRRSGGSIVALDARTGKLRWSRNFGESESSPLLSHGVVYAGTTEGGVYAFAAATGRELWSFDTGGPVKGSPAIANGRLFIGNYGGTFYALNARTGAPIWHNGGHGNFYAGASVVDGRVYVGNNDGHVYCFSARTGAYLWNPPFGTGSYVYASPAVWRGIVLVGSYDHNFYGINGATGTMRWDFPAAGAISGSASVVDGIVYFSTLNPHKTYALDAATGHLIEKWDDGEYSPAVAADGRLFFVGEGRIYALAPR